MVLEMENVYRFTLESRSPVASAYLACINDHLCDSAWRRPHRQSSWPQI